MPGYKKKTEKTAPARRAAIYARVSSKEQAEGYSIDAQLGALREYCQKKGLLIVKEFVEAETAKESGRSQFRDLVAIVSTDAVQAIVVEKTDRIYRNLKDRVIIDDLGIELHLVKEGEVISKASRSHAKFVHDMKLVVAKNYIDNLSEEASKGMAEKARQGIYPSYAPIGYINRDKHLDPDPERAPLVKELFEQYSLGLLSLNQAAKFAATLGLTTRKGNRIPKCSIAWMLQNPIYYGLIRWNGEEYAAARDHQPIISKALFERVQDVLHGKKPRSLSRKDYPFVYRGLVSCGHCGCQLTVELKKQRYVYYHCTGNRGVCPGEKVVNENVITEQIAEKLEGMRLSPKMLAWVGETLKESFSEERDARVFQEKRLHREESRLKKRLEDLVVSKIDGDISSEVYKELKSKWESELAEARIGLRSFERPNQDFCDDAFQIIELASNASNRFKMANSEEKRSLLGYLCSNFSWKDGNLEIQLQKPFDKLLNANKMSPENSESSVWWSTLAEIRTWRRTSGAA